MSLNEQKVDRQHHIAFREIFPFLSVGVKKGKYGNLALSDYGLFLCVF
jgi:hypothetical protein